MSVSPTGRRRRRPGRRRPRSASSSGAAAGEPGEVALAVVEHLAYRRGSAGGAPGRRPGARLPWPVKRNPVPGTPGHDARRRRCRVAAFRAARSRQPRVEGAGERGGGVAPYRQPVPPVGRGRRGVVTRSAGSRAGVGAQMVAEGAGRWRPGRPRCGRTAASTPGRRSRARRCRTGADGLGRPPPGRGGRWCRRRPGS